MKSHPMHYCIPQKLRAASDFSVIVGGKPFIHNIEIRNSLVFFLIIPVTSKRKPPTMKRCNVSSFITLRRNFLCNSRFQALQDFVYPHLEATKLPSKLTPTGVQ